MKKLVFIFAIVAFALQSCSWTVPFYIINNTNKPVQVEVSLMDLAKGIPVFENASGTANAYAIGKNFGIDYDIPVSVTKVRGIDDFHYSVSLPANTALCIGELQNERYNTHDQHFNNDRVFNLKRIIINCEGNKTEITNINFDNYFYESNNKVIYPVKSSQR